MFSEYKPINPTNKQAQTCLKVCQMMITINLKPEIEALIQEKATSQDLSIEQYIEIFIEK